MTLDLRLLPDDEPLVKKALAFMFESQELAANAAVQMKSAGVTLHGLSGTMLNRKLKDNKRIWRTFPARIRAEAWKRFESQIENYTIDAKFLQDNVSITPGKILEVKR